MLLKIFSVYDSGAGFYGQPVFSKSKGEFLRSFAQASNDPGCTIGAHPQDFTAFEVGEYDDETCKFTFLPAPVALGKAVEYVRPTGDSERP